MPAEYSYVYSEQPPPEKNKSQRHGIGLSRSRAAFPQHVSAIVLIGLMQTAPPQAQRPWSLGGHRGGDTSPLMETRLRGKADPAALSAAGSVWRVGFLCVDRRSWI